MSFTLFPTDAQGVDPAEVTIAFSDGGRRRVVTGEDFEGTTGRVDTREYETRRSGTLRVEVEVAPSGAPIASGEVEIPLRSDWRWNVQLHRGERNPVDTCFGCAGYEAFAVAESARDSPADSLWVVWGGNSISNPVVY